VLSVKGVNLPFRDGLYLHFFVTLFLPIDKYSIKDMMTIINLRIFLFSVVRVLLYAGLFGLLLFAAGMYYIRWHILPDLPSIVHLKEVQMQIPLRVYSSEGLALAEYGVERRTPLKSKDIPPLLIKAVLAIEDARFYEHHGVDFKGVMRAMLQLFKTGEVSQGASTITMQLARNFFLTPEKKIKRKIREVFLAWRIEDELSKQEILELYLNKIFFGHRAHGIAAAAQVYYGKEVGQLTLAQMAMLAGLPKAPSANNPISNPPRALVRRNYILRRMLELQFISPQEYEQARAEPITAQRHGFAVDLYAPYIAEVVRAYMVERYGEQRAYSSGFQVYTTIDKKLQVAAQQALRNALLKYDRRHGYRGAVANIKLALPPAVNESEKKPQNTPFSANDMPATWKEAIAKALESYSIVGELVPVVVVHLENKSAQVINREGEILPLSWEGLAWARPYRNERSQGPPPKKARDVLALGDVVYVRRIEPKKPEPKPEKADDADDADAEDEPENQNQTTSVSWHLAQIPAVEGALVSLDPDDGRILALMGGFDYYNSKFNRVTQALRQPGSNFKPFIYSAAIHVKGYSPETKINDAPLVMRDGLGRVWRPQNYNKNSFKGWIPIRYALATSRNLVSIRLMRKVGVSRTLDYVSRFGFDRARLPANLTLSLGTPEITPLELVRGYATFANGGFLIEPYLIDRIEDSQGNIIWKATPRLVCRDCDVPLPVEEEKGEEKDSPPPPPAPKREKLPLLSGTVPTELSAEQQRNPFSLYAPRVITAQNAWFMTSMLQGVIEYGTGTKANQLGRSDLAGKTGTTNDQKDAWFTGYNANVVTSCWVGFDQPASLGKDETGAKAALPMWIDYMQIALGDSPSAVHSKPKRVANPKVMSDSDEEMEVNDSLLEFMQNGDMPSSFEAPPLPPGAPSGSDAINDIF